MEKPIKLNIPLVIHVACGRNFCIAISEGAKFLIGWGSNNFG